MTRPSSSLPPLAELARQLSSGELDAEALTEQHLARHRPELHAYRRFDPELARRAAARARARLEGGKAAPLTGIAVSIKDLYGVPGFDTWAGCPRALPARFERAGPVVQALLDQDAVVIGKTHTVQFARGGLGTNPHLPSPVNPWDAARERVPGGSSSGAGVSLCEGSAVLALGTDTAGSVRIPASMTGNAGLKLTAGRWSTDGIVPLSPTLDTPGLLARSVADLAWAFAALDGRLGGSPEVARALPIAGLRLARCAEDHLWQDCSPGVTEAVEAALAELSRAGAGVSARVLPEAASAIDLFLGHPLLTELGAFLRSELPEFIETLEPHVQEGIRLDVDAAKLEQSVRDVQQLSARARPLLGEVDAFVFPTVAVTPPALDELAAPGAYRRANLLALRNTCVANYLGTCALTLPVGFDAQGLPVGLQLLGAPGGEVRLLSVGRALEDVLGTLAVRAGAPPRIAATLG